MAKKKFFKAVAGRDCTTMGNGVQVVARCCPELRAPYSKSEPIPDYLSIVDHGVSLKKKEYAKLLKAEETEFNRLVRMLEQKQRTLIVVLQGRDASGKTGARVRLEEALNFDAKVFLAIPIGPPTDEEKSHPYLWRFHKYNRMPKFGQAHVFDRSWAERMLVERVLKLAPKEDLNRSYAEIRTFEWLLQSQGNILVKIWMDITKDEQLRRFEDRKRDKPDKISDSDFEARKQWDDYTECANEMFYRTGTDFAPWYIVSSEDKRYSRVAMLQIINAAMREALK